MDVNSELERVIRSYCSMDDEAQLIDFDTPMALLGIQSAQIVSLMLELEATFMTEFPNEFFTPEVFATPRSLRAALDDHLKQTGQYSGQDI